MFFYGTDCLLDNLIFGYSFIQISNHNLFFYRVNNNNVTSNNVIKIKEIKNENY
jgi:hypothetical protein